MLQCFKVVGVAKAAAVDEQLAPSGIRVIRVSRDHRAARSGIHRQSAHIDAAAGGPALGQRREVVSVAAATTINKLLALARRCIEVVSHEHSVAGARIWRQFTFGNGALSLFEHIDSRMRCVAGVGVCSSIATAHGSEVLRADIRARIASTGIVARARLLSTVFPRWALRVPVAGARAEVGDAHAENKRFTSVSIGTPVASTGRVKRGRTVRRGGDAIPYSIAIAASPDANLAAWALIVRHTHPLRADSLMGDSDASGCGLAGVSVVLSVTAAHGSVHSGALGRSKAAHTRGFTVSDLGRTIKGFRWAIIVGVAGNGFIAGSGIFDADSGVVSQTEVCMGLAVTAADRIVNLWT